MSCTRAPVPDTAMAGVTVVTKLLCAWPEGARFALLVYVSVTEMLGVHCQFSARAGVRNEPARITEHDRVCRGHELPSREPRLLCPHERSLVGLASARLPVAVPVSKGRAPTREPC